MGITKGLLYTTANRFSPSHLHLLFKQQLLLSIPTDFEIVSVSIGPCNVGKNFEIDWEYGRITLLKQIIYGLERMSCDYVFNADDDVFYNRTHFQFPYELHHIWYNCNIWTLDIIRDKVYFWMTKVGSAYSGNRIFLLEYFRDYLKNVDKKLKIIFEPSRSEAQVYYSNFPIIDIKHKNNLTNKFCKKHELENIFKHEAKCYYSGYHIPYWGTVNKGESIDYLVKAYERGDCS